jgi:hypothetical protein
MTASETVETRLAELGESLTDAAGGRALCRLDGSMTTAKELEGRAAALLEVRRGLRADPAIDLRSILARWQADREARLHNGAAPAWHAYLTGGVAELEAICRGA